MTRTRRRLLFSSRKNVQRLGGLLLVLVLLSACSTSAGNQTDTVSQTTDVPSFATALSKEVATAVVADVSETNTTSREAKSAPVTPAMEQLGVAGERFAATGDPNAPITVIEFSDYG